MQNDDKIYISYNQVHKLTKEAVERYRINEIYKPDLMIAIGGGGFIPARILRTFLKRQSGQNIPIQAIGLSLYEDLVTSDPSSDPDIIGTQVIKTQWLQFGPSYTDICPLLGKNILIVDEVDDTRTTLAYAVQELLKDIEEEKLKFIETNSAGTPIPETKLAIFVLHNKKKEKRMELPDPSIVNEGRYFAAKETPDKWLVYPWEANDIDEHTTKSSLQENNE
ncbi:36055_t:CDS:2 [Gigaspora margarita]|uniref:36055_t:CDS:1 n=1 Tax=Gigaspora margarita TaxID=4874 RepID=A0ABN7UWW7_GIGMA|nr:36055_t:CDS:2 [Gigaspora margarita]